MNALLEILHPDFLLRDAVISSVLVGVVCPLVGVYFVLRRMIFLGVALPQVSAAGIAFSFLVYDLTRGPHQHGNAPERVLALVGSLSFTLGALLLLAVLERSRQETGEARIGTAYAIAAAATLLFVTVDPFGEAQMVNLLKGDVITASGSSLDLLGAVFSVVVVALFAFRRELLLVSFDREMALVLGKRAGLWDALLYLLIGVTISAGVMVAGPLVTFSFLVIPPLTARMMTRSMLAFSLAASGLGGIAALSGFWVAYRLDLPLGPTEVALAGLLLFGAATARRLGRGGNG